jgi:hypothetical protein
MTTLTLAAQTAPAAPAFNTAFYATAATVIPVLFLAIAVQGRALETVTNAATNAAHDYQRARRSRARLKAATAQTRALLTVAIASLIVMDGVAGEIIAMVALQTQKGGAETFVATAVGALTYAAAATPAVSFAKAFRKTWHCSPKLWAQQKPQPARPQHRPPNRAKRTQLRTLRTQIG